MSEAGDRPLILRGRVQYGNRRPAAGARVTVLGLDLDPGDAAAAVGATRVEEDGSFELLVPDDVVTMLQGGAGPGRFGFHVTTDAGHSATKVMVVAHDAAPEDIEIRLNPPGYAPGYAAEDDVAAASDFEVGDADTWATPPSAGRGSTDRLLEEAVDALADIAGGGVGGRGGAGGGIGRQGVFDDRFFEERLQRLIGARVRSGDIEGLRRELDRAVVEEEVNGERRFVFRGTGLPRTGVAGRGTGAAGAVTTMVAGNALPPHLTGPQAILYRRAAADLDRVRQALAALEVRRPQNKAEFEALRSLIDGWLVNLVASFASDLRPPVARIEAIFADLLGENGLDRLGRLSGFRGGGGADGSAGGGDGGDGTDGDSTTDGGERWALKDMAAWAGAGARFADRRDGNGIDGTDDGPFVDPTDDSVEEEQASTRFLEVRTYVTSLKMQWNTFVGEFKGDPGSSAGTLNSRSLVLVARLGDVADAARELDLALALAPGSPSERQFTELDADGTTLDQFLAWLDTFVADGKSQLQDGSRVGIEAVARAAAPLAAVAACALGDDPSGTRRCPPPAGVLKERLVKRALQELRRSLDSIAVAPPDGTSGSGDRRRPAHGAAARSER